VNRNVCNEKWRRHWAHWLSSIFLLQTNNLST
jgi:hypothetical protein